MTTPSRWIWLLGALGLWIIPVAYGQSVDDEKRNLSHFQIPLQGGNFKSLQNRFNQVNENDALKDELQKGAEKRAQEFVERILKNQKDLGNLQKMKEEFANDPILKDRSLQDLLRQQVDSHKELSPERRQELGEMVKKLGESTGNGTSGGPSDPGLQRRDKDDDFEKRLSDLKSNDGQDSGQPFMGPRPGTPPSLSSEQPNPEESVRRWIVDNFNPNKGPLADSPAFQDALRELRRAPFNIEPPAADQAGWAGKFARWSEDMTKGLAKSEFLPKFDGSSLKKWRLPSMKSLPKIQSPISAPSFGPAPNVTLPSATTLSRALQVLWIALIAAAAILVWKLLGGNIPGVGRLRKAGWRLGPWPVSPDAVASRQDVVRAFEYLSLLKLGPTVKSRNHIELAAELGRVVNTRQAANHLSSVYEKARYTPANEPLSADAIAAAREELCFLAGAKIS